MASADAPTTFERKATGLVREAGWWDVLVYNVNFISIGLMAALLFTSRTHVLRVGRRPTAAARSGPRQLLPVPIRRSLR